MLYTRGFGKSVFSSSALYKVAPVKTSNHARVLNTRFSTTTGTAAPGAKKADSAATKKPKRTLSPELAKLDQLVLSRDAFYLKEDVFRNPLPTGDMVEKARQWADPKANLPPMDPSVPTSAFAIIKQSLRDALVGLESPEKSIRKHPELLWLDTLQPRPASKVLATMSAKTTIPQYLLKRILTQKPTIFDKYCTDKIADVKVVEAPTGAYMGSVVGWSYTPPTQEDIDLLRHYEIFPTHMIDAYAGVHSQAKIDQPKKEETKKEEPKKEEPKKH